MVRPIITNGKTGIGNFGVGVMPDGTSSTLRVLIKPDGFHFVPSDFEDVVLDNISFKSLSGNEYTLAFNDQGGLLVNGLPLVMKTNEEDEVILGNKTFENTLKLNNGLQLMNNDGVLYSISIDTTGNLKTEKVENDAKSNN